jgi:dimethylglycine dehydrogenase
MMVMSHQYLLFDTIPELAEWTAQSGHKLTLLRDVDSSYYLRQEKMGFNLGPYENPCRAHWAAPGDPMPDDFSFQLFPDDLDRLEWWIADARRAFPCWPKARLQKVINGPIPYTPDGNPLIGPMPGVPNAFEACVFTFGICQAGGAGKVLAEWVTEGAPEWDMWSSDPRRFTGFEDPAYTVAKGVEVYGHEYAIHFPAPTPGPQGRPAKRSPVYDRLKAMGAQFGALQRLGACAVVRAPRHDTSEVGATHLSARGAVVRRGRDGMCRGARRGAASSTCRVSRASTCAGRGRRRGWMRGSRGGCRARAGWGWPISPTTGAGSSPR